MKQKPIQYLDLTDDVFFKRYFSTNMQVLFSLIKSFLPISDDATDISLVNPDILGTASGTANQQNPSDDKLHLQDSSIPPATPDGKRVVLDLNVKLSSGENVNIEMQVYFDEHFMTRMVIYWGQLHTRQLKRGQKYSQVKPSYLLAFTLSDVFGEGDYINEITMTLRKHHGKQVTKDFEMVVVELVNFNKSYLELVDMRDRWCYIIKHSAELTAEQVEYLSQDGETKMALEHLMEVSKEERDEWNAISIQRREWEMQLKREAVEEKGRIQGMEEGLVQGMEEKQQEIALSMLQKGYEVSAISEVTGLPIPEIEKLK